MDKLEKKSFWETLKFWKSDAQNNHIQESVNPECILHPEILYKGVLIDFRQKKIKVQTDDVVFKMLNRHNFGFVLGALENEGNYVYLAIYKKPVYADVEDFGFRVGQEMWDDMDSKLYRLDYGLKITNYMISQSNFLELPDDFIWFGVLFDKDGNMLKSEEYLHWKVYRDTLKYEFVEASHKYLYQSMPFNWPYHHLLENFSCERGEDTRICAIMQHIITGKKYYLTLIHDRRECDKRAYYDSERKALTASHYTFREQEFIWPVGEGKRRQFSLDAFLLSREDLSAIIRFNAVFLEQKSFWTFNNDHLSSYLIYKGELIKTENCRSLVKHWKLEALDEDFFKRAQNNYFQLRDENGITLSGDFKRQEWKLIFP